MKITFTDKNACEVALANALLFTSKDTTRPILCSSKFEVDGDACRIVSTDSYVLACETVEVKAEKGAPDAFLIDRAYLTDMLRLVKATQVGTFSLTFDDRRFTFANELGSQCAGVTLEADYPNWEQLFPTPVVAGNRTTEMVNLSQKYLGIIAKVKTPKGKGAQPVSIDLPETHLKPVTWSVGTAIRGILMPVRCA